MRGLFGICLRAAIIVLAAFLIGIGVNLVSPRSIPWIYRPPTEVVTPELRIPLTDEKKAREFIDDGQTVFVDTREEQDYADGHVRGALSLPEPEKEQRFPEIQHLLSAEGRIILYCSGPDCDMAEKVAKFMGQLGYRNLMIMSSGFPAWKKAGFPVEGTEK